MKLFSTSFTLLLALTISLTGCGKPSGSIHEISDRVFELARLQLPVLDEGLTPETAPKTLDENGLLVTSDMNWWCSGFYPGSLWMVYERTGDETIRKIAEKNTLKLKDLLDHKTDHDIGFQINNSYGQALRITGEASWKPMIEAAADRLASRFLPQAHTLRSWDFVHKGRDWNHPVIIDNMMNLELLVSAARLFDRQDLLQVALEHAQTTLENHFREDYSCYHLVDYDSITGNARLKHTVQGFADESAWARGQAWAVYGFSMMARETGREEFLQQAENIARYLLGRLPEDGIPYWDFDSTAIPDDLRDASAGCIMASAFAELSSLTHDKSLQKALLEMSRKQVRTLSSDAYLNPEGSHQGFLLTHSVGNIPGGTEIDVPLTYADYYFLEALLRLEALE